MKWVVIGLLTFVSLCFGVAYWDYSREAPARAFRHKCWFDQSLPMTDDYGYLYCVDIRNSKIERFSE